MKHPASKLPLLERVNYLTVVAAIAAAEGKVTGAKFEKLQAFCEDLKLDRDGFGRVMAAASHPDVTCIGEVIAQLRFSELRFTLLTDLVFLAYADDELTVAEKQEIHAIADSLDVNAGQLAAMIKYVEAVRQAQKSPSVDHEDLKKLGGELAASLASAGVPLAAIAVSGSVFGLSAAGITSGLAALGLGLGMASGIGVVVGIGVGSYLGVRWLYRKMVGT